MKTDSFPSWFTDLLVAATLLSRIPLPQLPEAAFARAPNACWTYPIVGAVLGALAACAAGLSLALGLPAVFAAGVLLAALMLLTGAMHEDGLGDTADGFWGGVDHARRLDIMRDSHIGSFGVLALILITGLRWSAYAALLPLGLLQVIAVAALSRAGMACVMAALPHSRDDGLSKSVGRPDAPTAVLGLGIALLIGGLCVGGAAIGGLLAMLAGTAVVGMLARRKIGGQTGDVLGAAQQISEVCTLGAFVVLLA
ncbi:adenosylcobinamide-GDP ribazoletransferase [Roseobacter sinensis]|uniref:Adenosylcobinamide-GDP ribazoletransferase n=1 Tax=Roseobacter sinensis TaxID=2931391 RepID=A0ABT3BGD7_9RHOB|nr:adenosylcobinamide-GDP ribazoletransferase [Roseobacter sp. WL0113]MCV3272646.1 adenosylcobinamide-GDP ribazoletransferase [Roseobacter sp. WL0113]